MAFRTHACAARNTMYMVVYQEKMSYYNILNAILCYKIILRPIRDKGRLFKYMFKIRIFKPNTFYDGVITTVHTFCFYFYRSKVLDPLKS